MRIYEVCDPFTMTSIERMYGLYRAVRYVVDQDIPGDIVECGVWMGGSDGRGDDARPGGRHLPRSASL